MAASSRTPSDAVAQTPAVGRRDAVWLRLLRRPSLPGTVVAGWFFAQSLAPSLLARSWLFQGVVTGVSIALGYGIGLGLARLGHHVRVRRGWDGLPWRAGGDLRARLVVLGVVVAYAVVAAVRAVAQHRWTWDRLGYAPSSWWYVYVASILVALTVAVVLFAVGRVLKLAWSRITRLGTRMLPAWIAGSVALVLTAWIVLASFNTFVLQRSLDGLNEAFSARDLDVDEAPPPPASALRSGGPRSEVRWDEAGHEGRRFLTRGPTTEELAELAVGEVTEPIRVYVGRASADTVQQRAQLAVEELERFGAFDRSALLIVVPTGTGWVNEQIVQPMEYFHDGDIATVAVQYSHLPSPLAYLSEATAAGDTAVALVDAVEARLADGGREPDLYIAGESLGSFGGSQAFASLRDSRGRVDGALWVGPPETMRLRREAERVRRPGSLQIKPTVADGTAFVFANRLDDLRAVPADERAHSVFLQQADDPIVWWDWETMLREPDWLEEPLDPAVNPAMTWTPVTTFLQLAVDMAVSNDFDDDHGHLYGTQPASAWHAVVRPAGWDRGRLEALRDRLVGVAR